VLVASAEPKAVETLTCATGRPVASDPRLNEVERPVEPFGADWREHRTRYVAGHVPAGWEKPHNVAARLDEVIAEHATAGKPLVLAGHGMAFTTWLSWHGYIGDPAVFWRRLGLPDVILVEEGAVRRLLEN
jgi:broad specificity phosphatase PhoE